MNARVLMRVTMSVSRGCFCSSIPRFGYMPYRHTFTSRPFFAISTATVMGVNESYPKQVLM
jgi:hypothetical protein